MIAAIHVAVKRIEVERDDVTAADGQVENCRAAQKILFAPGLAADDKWSASGVAPFEDDPRAVFGTIEAGSAIGHAQPGAACAAERIGSGGRHGCAPGNTGGQARLACDAQDPPWHRSPLEIEFTGTGTSSSVHFSFPRTLDGDPLLGPPGLDAAEFTLRGAGFAVHSKFTLDPEFLH